MTCSRPHAQDATSLGSQFGIPPDADIRHRTWTITVDDDGAEFSTDPKTGKEMFGETEERVEAIIGSVVVRRSTRKAKALVLRDTRCRRACVIVCFSSEQNHRTSMGPAAIPGREMAQTIRRRVGS